MIRLPLACLRFTERYLPDTPLAAIFVPATVQRLRLGALDLALCPVLTAVTVLEVYAHDWRQEEYPPFPIHKFPAVESIDVDAFDTRLCVGGIAPLLNADFNGLQSLSRFSCRLDDPPSDLNLPSGCALHLAIFFCMAELKFSPGLASLDQVQSIECSLGGDGEDHERVDLGKFSKFRNLHQLELSRSCWPKPWVLDGFASLPRGIKSVKVTLGTGLNRDSVCPDPSYSPREARFERLSRNQGVLHRGHRSASASCATHSPHLFYYPAWALSLSL